MLKESGAVDAEHLNGADDVSAAEFLEPISRSLRASQRLARIEWQRAKLAWRGHTRRALMHTCEIVFVITLTMFAG